MFRRKRGSGKGDPVIAVRAAIGKRACVERSLALRADFGERQAEAFAARFHLRPGQCKGGVPVGGRGRENRVAVCCREVEPGKCFDFGQRLDANDIDTNHLPFGQPDQAVLAGITQADAKVVRGILKHWSLPAFTKGDSVFRSAEQTRQYLPQGLSRVLAGCRSGGAGGQGEQRQGPALAVEADGVLRPLGRRQPTHGTAGEPVQRVPAGMSSPFRINVSGPSEAPSPTRAL